MLLAVIALQIIVLLVLLILLLRRQQAAAAAPDPRQMELPDQITRLLTRHDALDAALRVGLTEQRREQAAEAQMGREAAQRAFSELRGEVTGSVAALVETLNRELAAVRRELAEANAQAAGKLQESSGKLQENVRQQHEVIQHRLTAAASETRQDQAAARETLHKLLGELNRDNAAHQERLRAAVGEALTRLNTDNTAKLEEMRVTVDEKLNATLHSRLTESFGQVTDQLNKVHSGLGEMTKLSEGVGDLSRIFTNVKTRGGFAEVQLGMLLEQMLAPAQYIRNARVKPNTQEVVEFAVRFPGHGGETLLPIDAKFPLDAWERLETAYAANDPAALESAGKVFEAAIRTEGKRIADKYICPPTTTPHAILFLPTEGLYAEVMRRDALQADVQAKHQVTIAGPSTLAAILTSFQMGFHMIALQQKGDEVWKVLAKAKTEFGNFEGLLTKVEKQVSTVQNTLHDLNKKTTTINRSLRSVSELPGGTVPGTMELELDDLGAPALRLVAVGEEVAG